MSFILHLALIGIGPVSASRRNIEQALEKT